MPPHVWLFNALVSLAAASGLLLLVAAIATGLIRQPVRRVRVIEIALYGLAALPIFAPLPTYPRWSPWGTLGVESIESSDVKLLDQPVASEVPASKSIATTLPTAQRAYPELRESSGAALRWGLLAVWGAGSGTFLAWSAVGWFAARRVLRDSHPAGARSRALLRTLAGSAGDRVRLVESSGVHQPCAFGWLRPTIVLPRGFGIRNAAQTLRWTLAHEWSHVERGDLRAWRLCSLVSCLYFYQPLYWYLRHQLHVCQDYLADAAAARCDQSPAEDYAEFLMLAAWAGRQPALGLGIGGRKTDLQRRILMLVDHSTSLEDKTPRRWTACAVPVAVLAVGFAASLLQAPLSPARAQEKAPPAKKAIANRLSYNDGTAEGKRSIAGTGEMVSFTLPAEGAKVAGVRIHGSRYGYPQPPKEDFMIYLLNADGAEVVATKPAPYSRFKRGQPQWVEVKFPKPVEVPKDFWVCVDFRAAQTKGVYVSTDSSSDGTHSRVGLPGSEPTETNIEGDWMIEVVLAK